MSRRLLVFTFLSIFVISGILPVSPNHAYAQAPGTQTGTILETMAASGYTYLHLKVGEEKHWVAIPATEVTQGADVTFLPGMTMENFHSKALDRTFEAIIFSPGLAGKNSKSPHGSLPKKASSSGSFADAVKKESVQPTAKPSATQTSGGSTGAMVPAMETQVEKATGENSYTVEEIFNKAEELNGKRVRVRGKVVKFSPNIMGKNWIHLQDGSGDPMKNTHDLVVTTTGQAKPDEVIITEGQVAAKKDFGFGYKYEVLLEEAQIIQ